RPEAPETPPTQAPGFAATPGVAAPLSVNDTGYPVSTTPGIAATPGVAAIRVQAVEGYTMVPNTIWDSLLRRLHPHDQLVYLRLYRLSRYKENGEVRGWCLVGFKKLQEATNLNRTAVIRALSRLEALGLLSRE